MEVCSILEVKIKSEWSVLPFASYLHASKGYIGGHTCTDIEIMGSEKTHKNKIFGT